ncbi:MAG: FimV/HubP family polar landmark protein, partial [Gammaproteobacteria bacterium]|nr:FimV/HubP family polar landmark protein [Gammaproteobacteria bacterium]
TQVYALGLGSVSVESALNQPLRVRIEIIQLGDTRLEDVNVQMASTDDFQRFNIERVGFLSNVRLSVEATPQGNFVTLITSQVVREPYLSFILETRWPNGRLLSEHTILLDLPVFDDQQASASARTPISPVLQRPDAATQPDQPFVEPAAPAVTPPTQSTQPIIEPEVIDAPALQPQDLTPELEEVIPEPESVTQEAEILPEDLVQEESAEPVDEPQQPELAVEEDPQAVEPAAEAVVEEQAVAVVEEIVEETVEEQAVAVEPEPEPVQAEVTEEIEVEPEPELAPVEVAEEIAADEEPETPDLAEEIETSATDTLSDIALRVRLSNSVTIQQTMLALQQLNPDAFDDGNINQLRSGQVMRVPTLAEVEAIDPQEAIDEVTRQNQQVAEVDVEPLAAPTDATPDQDDQPQGQLSVVSSDADAINASSGISELNDEENAELDRRIAELENQLALRQEEADRARIEREDLDSRMAELEEQIADAQEIIRLQDLQLAQLQETLAAAAAEAAAQAEAEAAQAEAAIPVSSSSTLFDDVMRLLTGNTLMMGFGIAL